MGTSIPAGPSAEEQAMLLEKEAQLAEERGKRARDFQRESDALREARERGQRLLIDLQEKERVTRLEQQERKAAGVSDSLESLGDIDTQIADMYASLSFGVADLPGDENNVIHTEERPE